MSSEWKEIYELSSTPGLHDVAFAVMDTVKRSKSLATNKKYDAYFIKFKSWCRQFNLSSLPAKDSTVSMYLTSLIQSGCSVAVLTSNFYSVRWYHDMYLFKDPCGSRLVKLVFKGGKRILSKPIQKKEPITADIIIKLFDLYKDNLNLQNSRSLCMFLLAYSGFFLYKELSNIKTNNIFFRHSCRNIC